jgi:hypothetical protein
MAALVRARHGVNHAPRVLTEPCELRFRRKRMVRSLNRSGSQTAHREETKVMKSYVESFGYQFNAVDFAIRSTPALCIGMIVFITLYDVFW